ncbi:unnamed protein product [Cylicocyclus nassatus]|uniref:Uncharacterized protein n=1 Tax=Cylicocyclus nassatus TaxID=53992 RepID=A0AA36LZG1_CYLNA|nr:unnamed protein product [Cylicocyclus nassatus]
MKAVKAQSAASRKKNISSISIGPDMDTHPSVSLASTEAPVKPANVRSEMASLSSSDTRTSKDTGGRTIHRLQEDFMDFKKEVEQQYQELRKWVYSMCQRYDTVLTRDRRSGSDASRQNFHQEHKNAQEEAARTRQTSKKEEKKRKQNFKKQSEHLGGFATGMESQKDSISWRSITTTLKGDKTKPEHLSRNLLGEAGVYELHSYHSTRNAKRAKHSNVGYSGSDGKQSSGQRQTQKRLMNSTEVENRSYSPEAPQKATGEAVGSGPRRRPTYAPREIEKQGYKAPR